MSHVGSSILLVAFGALAASATPACNREGAPPVAPVDTIDARDGGPPATLFISAPPPVSRERCTARLRPATIKTNPGCTLDEQISHGDGTLLYPCSGEGTVEALFGEHRFEGNLSEGGVHLTLGTELDWDDGCHWQTTQAIRGTWKNEGKRPKLSWSYTEAPVSGPNGLGACLGSCKASADIEIEVTP